MNSFNFGGQNADPEIVRENFNKIARYLTEADACVLSLQSESANISALGANAAIRTFTVFMRSDTGACDVTIPDPASFDYSIIGKKDTLFFFKGLSGSSSKTVTVNSGTVEGENSFTLANDQTFCIQSDGTEYKILFDSSAMTGGSGDTGVESVTGYNVDNTDPQNPVILAVQVDGDTITGSGTVGDPFVASTSGSGDTPDRFGLEDVTTLTDRTVDMEINSLILNNIKTLEVLDSATNQLLLIDAINGGSVISATDGTGFSELSLQSSTGGGYKILIFASDGINNVRGIFDAVARKISLFSNALKLVCGVQYQYTPVNSNYSILVNDYTIDCFDLSGPGTFTVTLPDASVIAGQVYIIKNSGTGTITVAAQSGQTIDGSSTKTLSVQYSSITVQASNSNSWAIISKV